MDPHPITDEEAVAAADKEMEARANRAKELLSQRYVGLKRQQVRGRRRVDDDERSSRLPYCVWTYLLLTHMCYHRVIPGGSQESKDAARASNGGDDRR